MTPAPGPRFFLGRKMQLAFLVADMDAALRLWTQTLQAGPFVVFEKALGTRQFIHRGQPSAVDFSLALSYIGDTQIELICQNNDAPSIYTEARRDAAGNAGPHHIAFWPDDMQAAFTQLSAQGFEEVASIRSPEGDVDVYYMSAPAEFGAMLEIVPMSSARRVYFSHIKALCERPDVTQRVLRFENKDHFMKAIAAGEV